ncbi:HDOD domain-containing protein [Chitinimonas sp. BJYL2]|uniref:HDOD domain-containing protein n=1 Tax=Chitinimonas sp. BJYL2 TaxID=2976696 RepID=UPI0022B48EEF|nr:HDOD domain-containing protein [Chitinimonas sp. BJYL2]
MSEPFPNSIEAWIKHFESNTIPILTKTRSALQALIAKGDDATVLDLAQIVRHDALLALQVLRYLQSHRSRQQHTDVTTVERIILMVGVNPLLDAYAQCTTVEELLGEHGGALHVVRSIMFRAHHAACCAEVWAGYRHDIDGTEVVTATLLRDIAEILIACFAPKLALRIRAMQQMDRRLRSAMAQKAVLGFPYIDLQMAMVEQWKLPPTLRMLMDEHHAEHPRVKTVSTAVAYARHTSTSWTDAAIPDDIQAVADMTRLGYDKAIHVTLEASRKAYTSWAWYSDTEPAPPPADKAMQEELSDDNTQTKSQP